jgi:peptide/nickel transport system ATP-binding protein
MIFQEPMSSFSPLYTIGYQIMEVIQLHKDISKKEAKRITVELLKKVGIADAENAVDRYPYEFSGGMRQRAMIAKALSCNPLLLIADEPTTALDVTIQNQILNLMCDMKQEFRTSIIFITHDLGVVGQMADEVAIMYMGKIIEQGTTREIFKNPKHPYTMKLLEAVPRLGNLEARRRLETIRGNPVCLIVRPAVHFVPGAIILCPVFVTLLFQISGKFLKTTRLPVICTDMERIINEYINGY